MTASNCPITINKNIWYYEHKKYITVVCYDDNGDNPRMFDIPLRLLRASLARIAVKPKKRPMLRKK
jgi:hypothetical protein